MKIRAGFVSNSSSSSFCIMGMYVGYGWEERDKFEELLKDSDLCIKGGCMEGDDSVYIGLPVSNMKEDETLAQFKERVNSQLPDCVEKKSHWITDGGYNG